jgi:hypothetical protein
VEGKALQDLKHVTTVVASTPLATFSAPAITAIAAVVATISETMTNYVYPAVISSASVATASTGCYCDAAPILSPRHHRGLVVTEEMPL